MANKREINRSPAPVTDVQLIDGGYDVEAINKEYAVVLISGRVAIIKTDLIEANGGVLQALLSLQGFRDWNLNRFVRISNESKKLADYWLGDSKRRQYKGFVFRPDQDVHPDGFYNLWSGFSVEPDPRGDAICSLFLEHILDNVCCGDAEKNRWVLTWLAQMVQQPASPVGTSLVLRGRQGTGKTKVGEVIGRLFPSSYMLVDSPRYLFGNFNAHMANCLLLQADEGFWAGDHEAAGQLKGIVTRKTHPIEKKGYDTIQVQSFMRLMITSNSDWVTPADFEERRFCILDVGESQIQNHDYFKAIDDELNNGGLAGLLHYLLHYDLTQIDVRQVLKTDGLLDQKLDSMDPPMRWWFDCLSRGSIDQGKSNWKTVVFTEPFRVSFRGYCDQWHIRSQINPRSLGKMLKKVAPHATRRSAVKADYIGYSESDTSDSDGQRARVYVLGELQECRRAFEKAIGHEIEWD